MFELFTGTGFRYDLQNHHMLKICDAKTVHYGTEALSLWKLIYGLFFLVK